jgi:hypothetical protein
MWSPFLSKVFNLWDETMIRSAGKNSTNQPTNQKKSRILESKGVYSYVFFYLFHRSSPLACVGMIYCFLNCFLFKNIFLYFLKTLLKLLLHCAIKHSDTLVVCFYFCQNFKIRRIVFFSFIIFKYFCWELREIKKGQRENRGKHSRRVLWWNGKRNQINSSRLITVYIVQFSNTYCHTPPQYVSLSLSLCIVVFLQLS